MGHIIAEILFTALMLALPAGIIIVFVVDYIRARRQGKTYTQYFRESPSGRRFEQIRKASQAIEQDKQMWRDVEEVAREAASGANERDKQMWRDVEEVARKFREGR
jgi:hypothetical protein